jgi:L-iditol 2-dehydrogenase
MRAVRAAAAGDLAVREVPPPAPAPGEVLVEVIATAVCATDRKATTRDHHPARTLGHEVTGRAPDGTLVGVHPEVSCGLCSACLAGWQNRCPYRQALGLDRDGGLAELLAVPPAQLVPLGGLDPVTATMLEPLACAVHAVAVTGLGDPVTGGQAGPAVVVGAGAMGILCAWVLQAAGRPVAVCQRSTGRRRLARELGIDIAFGPGDDPVRQLGQAPAGIVVTAPGTEPLRWALAQVAVGGVVHAFAGTPGGMPVDANLVHYRHLRLVGSTGSRLADYRRARELVAGGEVKLDRLPHRVVGWDGAAAAVLGRPGGGALKTIVAVR